MKSRAKAIAYWAATGMIVFAMFSGGVAELMHRPETINGMKELGYPVYFIMIIGFWKLLGSAALLAPGLPRVKEWAYAGIFFNMTGAAVSHVVNDSARWHFGVTLSLAAITIASWALRPASRTLVAGWLDRGEQRVLRIDEYASVSTGGVVREPTSLHGQLTPGLVRS